MKQILIEMHWLSKTV